MTVPEGVRSTPAYAPDVVERLEDDHARFRRALGELLEDHGPGRAARFDELARDLARHESLEEELVWPVVARAGEEAARMRRLALAQEREAKNLLATAMRRSLVRPDSPAFERSLRRLRRAVERHARHEERSVFPLLRDANDGRRLRLMGAAIGAGRHVAPTRPHPDGPETPAGILLAAPIAGPLDRVRDLGRRLVRSRLGRRPGG